MKGTKKIQLGSESVTLRLTTGVHEDFQEYKEQEDLSDEDMNKFKHQRIMFALMELYATDDGWKDPDILEKAKDNSFKFKNLGFDQIDEINALTDEIAGEVGEPEEGNE